MRADKYFKLICKKLNLKSKPYTYYKSFDNVKIADRGSFSIIPNDFSLESPQMKTDLLRLRQLGIMVERADLYHIRVININDIEDITTLYDNHVAEFNEFASRILPILTTENKDFYKSRFRLEVENIHNFTKDGCLILNNLLSSEDEIFLYNNLIGTMQLTSALVDRGNCVYPKNFEHMKFLLDMSDDELGLYVRMRYL